MPPERPEPPLRVTRVVAGFRQVMRVAAAMSRQPEYRAYFGWLSWWGLRALAPLFYLRVTRRHRPTLVLVERGGDLLGSVSFTPSGEIGNWVLLGAGTPRRHVLRLLQLEVDRELAAVERTFYAHTFVANASLIAALQRRGFALVPHERYVMTLLLGPSTFSWPGRRPSRLPFVRVKQMVRLVRTAG